MNINKIAEHIGMAITGSGLVMLAIIFVLVVK